MKNFLKLFLVLVTALFVSNSRAEEKKHHVANVDHSAPVESEVTIDSSELGEDIKVTEDCESVGNVCLTSYVSKDKVLLVAENKSAATTTLNIDYFLNNMQAEMSSEGKNIILLPGEKKKIDIIRVIDPDYNYTFNYSYVSYLGVIDAVHDDGYVYDLPFEAGTHHMLWQGVGGSFSHSDEENYYAYDLKMPIGTPVLAARGGRVVEVVDDHTEGGVDTSLKDKANYIYIQHSDGTIANYSHIKPNGSLVSVGDEVQKGQKIAFSGDTGYTTAAHLHFGVFKVIRGGKYKAVPVKMKTSKGVIDKLKAGEFYEK